MRIKNLICVGLCALSITASFAQSETKEDLAKTLTAPSAQMSSVASIPGVAKANDNDPQKHPRIREIASQLRCLVCQNENIADSNAELAIDLRNEVARQVKEGRSNEEILNFMVERYGDYVLYKPPFKAKTILLWCGPILFFFLAVFVFIRLGKTRANHNTLTQKEKELGLALLTRQKTIEEVSKELGA